MEELKVLWESKYPKHKQNIPIFFSYLIYVSLFIILVAVFFGIIIKFSIDSWPILIILLFGIIILIFSLLNKVKLDSKVISIKIYKDFIEIWDKKGFFKKRHELRNIDAMEIIYLIIGGEGGTIPDYIRISLKEKTEKIFSYVIDYSAVDLNYNLASLIEAINKIGFYEFPEENNFWYRRLRQNEQLPPTIENFSRAIDFISKKSFGGKILKFFWSFLKKHS